MASFFNQISLKGLDQIDYLDLNDICVKSDELHDLFESRKNEIKNKINPTGRKLLSKDNVATNCSLKARHQPKWQLN